jgi:uncharacterized paraquat-inducible protein A
MYKTKHKRNRIKLRKLLEKWLVPPLFFVIMVMAFFIVKYYWHLSFGWNSLELGILLGAILLMLIFIPSKKKDKK